MTHTERDSGVPEGELVFRIELRADVPVLVWPNGSCRPAGEPECAMYATIARLQREAEGLRRENQELRAAHHDATDGISGTLLKDQIEALTRERDEARRDARVLQDRLDWSNEILNDEEGP